MDIPREIMTPAIRTDDRCRDAPRMRQRKGLVTRLLLVDAWMIAVLRGTGVAILEGFAQVGMAHAAIPMPDADDQAAADAAEPQFRRHRQAMEQLRALASIPD